jgi:glucose/arabinose dehydrogenase
LPTVAVVPIVSRLRAVLLPVLVATGLLASACGGGQAATSAALAPATTVPAALVAIGEGVQGPAGLTATAYAKGLANAAGFAFDRAGQLWVATAASEDKGTDGVFVVKGAGATPLQVISDIQTPMGLLWVGDTLYVASIGRVDAFSGFNGTEFADVHQVLELPEGVGMSNGMVLAADGRVLLGISAPCDSCTPTSAYSASIVSFEPDGSDLKVDTSGIRAPIGLAYYPGTSDLFVTMNQRDDLGDATPGDWLSIVTKGQDWGFPACYGQSTDACASKPQPLAELDEHAALSGIAIVTGQLGPTVGTSAIVAEWAKGKVQRVALQKQGTTYTAAVEPFLTGIEKPVAVQLAPDGSLLVGDWATGTIYRIAKAA